MEGEKNGNFASLEQSATIPSDFLEENETA